MTLNNKELFSENQKLVAGVGQADFNLQSSLLAILQKVQDCHYSANLHFPCYKENQANYLPVKKENIRILLRRNILLATANNSLKNIFHLNSDNLPVGGR